MNSTFPLNQTLYFDFSHDTNIMSIITAFGTWLIQSVSANKWPACKSATHCVSYGALRSQHDIRNYQDILNPSKQLVLPTQPRRRCQTTIPAAALPPTFTFS